ncbi:type VI secretion system tube protein Hcp [Poseidonocella sp. HB161398]|uniref:type VI secretion system tube protein Hcp n=1 Tax=Poseidonocella sp. HB161398 TaxID=2320855 RepID=UPI0011080EC1|nr:type VI secretion system tube protein Hcp [Poseidonocella sp. HB161398]
MAHDAYLFFPSAVQGVWPRGEAQVGNDRGAIMLTDQWGFALENKLNIGPQTMGAGAGKAEFEAFTIKKQIDSASSHLLEACGRVCHFNNVQLKLRKSTGSSNGKLNNYLTWTFHMLAVEKVEWTYGDPAPEETITFKFGVCKIEYQKQDDYGNLTQAGLSAWNQVDNNNSETIGAR